MNFRKDINGLRALAVLSVVLYHFNVPFFAGGFVGVDIFFVISGYLMTGIILTRINNYSFSLIGFYLDRCRRIIPALAFLCIVVAIVGYYYVVPTDYEQIGKHIYNSALFISNINYYHEVNYFDTDSKLKWLLHTWSLSVEWQFYLIYPIVIMAAHAIGGFRFVKTFIVCIFFLSLCYSVYASYYEKEAAFYLIQSRAWEMAAGGIAYLFPAFRNTKYRRSINNTGIALLLFSVFFIDHSQPWPGILALLPVLGTWLVIKSGSQRCYLLDNKVFQFLGDISYSVYLWHWPVLVFCGYRMLAGSYIVIAGILSSIVIGYASFVMIENPTRKLLGKLKSKRFSEIFLCLILVAIPFGVGSRIFKDGGMPERYPFSLITTKQLMQERARYWVDGDKLHPIPKNGSKKVVIVGNSHGIDLTYALTTNGLKGDITYLRTTNHCSNFGYTANEPADVVMCEKIKQEVLASPDLKDADVVFLHDDWARRDIEGTKNMVSAVLNATKGMVYVLGPKMKFTATPSIIVKNAMDDRITSVEGINNFASKYYVHDKVKISNDVKEILHVISNSRFHYIDTMSIQCGNRVECAILSDDGKDFLYFDTGHFTLAGAKDFGGRLKSSYSFLFE
ncbi:acyltransferase family protein [Escherichia coli]|uniref:acyltransferase family protein n=1 Tax=Escherichia coli TaxID=562 RepID=UPI0015960495|nr:acyltransferase family protein [Escherichia coli]